MQGASLYAAGDAAAATEKSLQGNTSTTAETAELMYWRLFGYALVAINLVATFAYNIVCKRTLKKMELQAPPPPHARTCRAAAAISRCVSLMWLRFSTTPMLCRCLYLPQSTVKAWTLACLNLQER